MLITGVKKRKYLNFFNKTLNGTRKLSEVKMISEVDDKDRPQVVVLFEWINNCGNMQISIASRPGWVASRRFLRECFYYAFVTCGATLCSAIVDERRVKALEFNERIGMRKEFDRPIRNFFGNFDGWLLCMRKDECRWIKGYTR
jgi:hypothetical protein